MSYANGRPERVIQLFETAVVREPEERLAYLQEACADDPEVRREVEALLADADAETVIDGPLEDAIADLLGNDTVTPGTRLGPYRIDSLLGAGGMGEVYRATDTVLGRQVAIKMLPAAVAADPERIARFRREAKVLASLNHSNIGAIYGVEAAGSGPDSTLGLVLELVEGPTLADRIASGPLPIDEALAVARQIAEALEAAHQQGIVHRDLKPANIKVREDGVVKVLDFGLARLDDALTGDLSSGHAAADSATITTPAMKAAGVLLGTAAYMSPEQAKGRPADKRSDIWAFGCVLYEMLTGRRAFSGEDVTDTLAAVVRGETDYTALPRETPEALQALIRGCLTRDRHRRLGDIAAARFVLDNMASLLAPVVVTVPSAVRSVRWRWGIAVAVGGAALGIAALTAVTIRHFAPTSTPSITRYSIEPSGPAAPEIDLVSRDLAVLPNGTVVYKGVGTQGTTQLFLRAREDIEPTLLVTPGAAPFASPDGRRIGYIDVAAGNPALKTVPATGGPAFTVCGLGTYPSAGATWGDDNTIVFATIDRSTGLYRVPATGGRPDILTTPDVAHGEGDHVWPQFLPQARAVLFTIISSADSEEPSHIAVLDLRSGRKKLLNLPGASHAQYTSSGHLVYLAGSTLFAVPFDLDRLEVQGKPTPLPIQIATTGAGAAEFDIGRDGTLAYLPPGLIANAPKALVWVDREAREEPVAGAEARPYMHPRLSPDGSRLAVRIAGTIYVWDFARRALQRVGFESDNQGAPVWIDNRSVVYYTTPLRSGRAFPTNAGKLFRRAVDGTGNAETLTPDDAPPGVLVPSSFGAGVLLAGMLQASDVLKLTLSEHRLTRWYQTPFEERNAEISPNGRWVAYEGNSQPQSDQFNVYVRPFATPSARLLEISTNGGREPAWSHDGTELFFIGTDGALYSARFDPESGVAEPSRQIVPGRYYHGSRAGTFAVRMYDVAKDGRFLMIKDAVADRSTAAASIIVTQNWLEELKRLVPAK